MRKTKISDIIIVAFGIGLISFFIVLPFLLERSNENSMIKESHKMRKINFSINSDVENIEMVKRLHQVVGTIYSEDESINLIVSEESNMYSNENDGLEYTKQLKLMNEIEGFCGVFSECIEHNISTFITLDEADDEENIIKLEYTYGTGKIKYYYDKKTDKVLEFTITSDKVSSFSEDNKQGILNAMVEYLNLRIVGDWQYDGEGLVSKKAHIKILCNIDSNTMRVYIDIDNNLTNGNIE